MPRKYSPAPAGRAPIWSLPDTLSAYARALRLPVKTMRRIFRDQTIRNRKVGRGIFQADLADLPPCLHARFGGEAANIPKMPESSRQDQNPTSPSILRLGA